MTDKAISSPDTRNHFSGSDAASTQPATKQFVVNATGNLFVATTLSSATDPGKISPEAEKAFAQVSVFYSALTKAMAEADKSLFDFEALNNLISRSGMFVKVTKSEIEFSSESYGLTLGSDLIKALLGFTGGLGAIANSLTGLMQSVGKEAVELSAKEDNKTTRVGTIIFVCEYLLGMVSIAPIVVSVDINEAKNNYKAGPCLKYESAKTKIDLEKETYLFVPPTFIEEAAALNKAMENEEFKELVEKMKRDINTPLPQ